MWNHQNVCCLQCIRFPAWKNYRKMLHGACHKGLSTSPSAELHFLWSNLALSSNFLSVHIYWAPTGSERRETSKPFRELHVTGTGTQGTENGNKIGTAISNYAIRKLQGEVLLDSSLKREEAISQENSRWEEIPGEEAVREIKCLSILWELTIIWLWEGRGQY